ncbi:MAG: hypothetical protein AWU57_2513 [Marinobacter sp. T13-3]|nr:MAG: hypothetical protein AWU57_2513 [Marinobacter sp. T13-3]
MKHPISIMAFIMLLGIIVFAVMFRYEYMGTRLGFEVRADRWSGCIQTWNNNENTYKPLEQSCQ